MQGRLSGKVAIITGGARGQGASHARFMIKEGAKVVVTDLRVEQGEALAAELGAAVRFIQHDVAKPEDWERVVAGTEAAFGPVNVLVNNAGIGFLKNLEHTSLEEYQHVIAVCQTSVFLGMRAVIASMRRAGGGSIINISSIVADRGIPGNIAYSAAKAAIVGMGKVAALELLEDNIRVNTIMPGMIRTPAVEELPAERIPELNEGIPIKRMASVEEVSHLVVYLASDESSYSTGSDFVVDGGIRAAR